MPFFEFTWYNILLEGYFAITGPVMFIGQSKAEEGAVVWSKFAIGKTFPYPCAARSGMLCKYIPSLVLLALRSTLLTSSYPLDATSAMVGVHFTKRVLEVLFLHSFAGSPTEDLMSSSVIGAFYALESWCLTKDGVGASGSLMFLGLVVFCIGITGNLYHHMLLASLRKPSNALLASSPLPAQGKYKIPQGGLFGLVTCPHYMFECLAFWGIAIVSSSLIPLTIAVHLTLFLSGQSSSTRRWYVDKFGDKWPKERKNMIPFVY